MWSKIVALSVTAIVVGGCSTEAPGTAAPVPDETPAATEASKPQRGSSTAGPSVATPSSESPLDGVAPCSLLSDAERGTLGLKSTPKPKDLDDRRSCQFSEDGFTAGVNVFYRLGLDSVEASNIGVKSVPIVGKHKALQSMFGISCAITMEISTTAIVSASASAGTDARSCEIAMKIAELIEPKLP